MPRRPRTLPAGCIRALDKDSSSASGDHDEARASSSHKADVDANAQQQQAGNIGNRFASVRRRKEEQESFDEAPVAVTGADVSEAMSGIGSGKIVALSVGFYGAMTAVAIALGEANGSMGIYAEFLQGWDILAGLGFLAPFVLGLLAAVNYSDTVPALSQMRDSYKATLVPMLSAVPTWGHCVMALGAAVGEEALFRAFMQSSVLASLPLNGSPAVGASVAVTSLVFGLLHTLSPATFLWATAGGVLLGLEYHAAGLGAAIITHWLYDWFAFYYLCSVWGASGSKDADA